MNKLRKTIGHISGNPLLGAIPYFVELKYFGNHYNIHLSTVFACGE